MSAPRKVTDMRLLGVLREDILGPQTVTMVRKMATEVASERLRGAGTAAKENQSRLDALKREIKTLSMRSPAADSRRR